MTESCVYLVCYYGGTHLGNRHFEIGQNMAGTAIKNQKIFYVARARRRQQWVDSQSSIYTDASYLTEEDEETNVQEEQVMTEGTTANV